jgi:CDGSH-type Zn-finger protein
MADAVVTIRVRDNGPYVVEGPVQVLDAGRKAIPTSFWQTAIALCRCGHSQNKPFCDGSHRTSGFQASERAPAAPSS